MWQYYHSVTLDVDKCKGCTNCIKGCPTEAIRVRNGKAIIQENRCIDCGECIRVCPNNAKYASTDGLEKLREFKFKAALTAPAFYAQFKEGITKENIMNALIKIGFDEVYEVPLAAEEVSLAIREYLEKNKGVRPLISSACPAVLRLIQIRFPELIKNIIPIKPPTEVAAQRAKEVIIKTYGYKEEEIGVFFISPCPAKVAFTKQPIGMKKSYINGVLSMAGIYGEVLKNLDDGNFKSIFKSSCGIGINWGRSGGESLAIGIGNTLSVDGIHNCINVLEQIELDKLSDIDYIECQACLGGCIGGALTVENRFAATSKLRRISENTGFKTEIEAEDVINDFKKGFYNFEEKISARPSMKLDEDIVKAIQKMDLLEKVLKELPGLDCGSCGCPNCRALAEDIVQGLASETDCVFKLREKVKKLASQMLDLSQKLPPTMGSS